MAWAEGQRKVRYMVKLVLQISSWFSIALLAFVALLCGSYAIPRLAVPDLGPVLMRDALLLTTVAALSSVGILVFFVRRSAYPWIYVAAWLTMTINSIADWYVGRLKHPDIALTGFVILGIPVVFMAIESWMKRRAMGGQL